jgi:hypothetical protein
VRRVVLLLVSLTALASCDDDSPTGPASRNRTPLGIWGAERVSLTVSEVGAAFRTFCAEGDLDRPIVLDDQGRFDLTGRLVVTAGPAVVYDSARYTGRADTRTLILTVTGSSSGPTLGPYELTLGRETTIPDCPIVVY